MAGTYILGIDHGATGVAALVLDHAGRSLGRGYVPIREECPRPGWVQLDARQYLTASTGAAAQALDQAGLRAGDLAAIGIANQGETTVLWDRKTGEPIHPAISWQCRRTADFCTMLQKAGAAPEVRRRTGLILDPYFSASKVRWLLDHVDGARNRAERGELCYGSTDAFLFWQLTGGALHATDYSTASRTLLFNLETLAWDPWLLDLFGVPATLLPEILPSANRYGNARPDRFLGGSPALAGNMVDTNAALFGHRCFQPGMAKATFGTGVFVNMNTGARCRISQHNLLSYAAWGLAGRVEYALEGGAYIAGAAMQWLRDGLGLIRDYQEAELLARSVADTAGTFFVPAFSGLAAPHWDMHARGTIVGLTRGASRAHLVRATLEAVAFQVRDIVRAMETDTGIHLSSLLVDGGPTRNAFLMQFLADLLQVPVQVSDEPDITAYGAALAAGFTVGRWNLDELAAMPRTAHKFQPQRPRAEMEALAAGWQRAVERSRGWAE